MKTLAPEFEGVDNHFAIDWPGGFDAAIGGMAGNGRGRPCAQPDRRGFYQEVRKMASVKLSLAHSPEGQKVLAAAVELGGEARDEAQGFGSQDFRLRRADWSVNLKVKLANLGTTGHYLS